MNTSLTRKDSTVKAAVEAVKRGYQPVPIISRGKGPRLAGWTRLKWDPEDLDDVRQKFGDWHDEGMTNIGLLLGDPSGGLVDVDLDNIYAMRLRHYLLPPTPMRSGRTSRPDSHYWYRVKEGTLLGNRRHMMPDGSVSIELRSTSQQTVIPPSKHENGDTYLWTMQPWGGKAGPLEIDGRKLGVQVAAIGLGAVLLENWPAEGSRHEAYLALAGGLLRYGDGVHPLWEKFLPTMITALAEATHDDDGPEKRVDEVMSTTIARLKAGETAIGFGRLAEILGDRTVDQVRELAQEVVSAAGFSEHRPTVDVTPSEPMIGDDAEPEVAFVERDPLGERVGSWEPVDLDPYLSGELEVPKPSILKRSDGRSLMYGGRVNMLFGSSESAKSWIALQTCLQEISRGHRVVFLDFEDEPANTLARLRLLGAGTDDIRLHFTYIRPEEPLAPMQRNRWGQTNVTGQGSLNESLLNQAIREVNPSLIVADGMTVLYGLHGLDSNDAVSTDVITGWLKSLTRNGRTSVIVIDHTSKGAPKGALPIGSQHKQAMVQGTLIQVWPLSQPAPGTIGQVELVVVKDRPGEVRKISLKSGDKAQVSALVTLDSTKEGETVLTIDPPVEKSAGPEQDVDLSNVRAAEQAMELREWEERVKIAYGGELGKSLSLPEIRDLLEHFGHPQKVNNAVSRLVEQGWLEAVGRTKGRRYVLRIGNAGYERDDEPEIIDPSQEYIHTWRASEDGTPEEGFEEVPGN